MVSRTFNIHRTFSLHKKVFIAEKGSVDIMIRFDNLKFFILRKKLYF